MAKKNKLDNEQKSAYLIPIMMILLLVPMIVRLKVIPIEGEMFKFWNGEKYNADFFSYYKMVLFLILASLSAITFFIRHKMEYFIEFKKSKLYIPLGIYAILVLMSALFSKYKGIAFFGFIDRYEGALMILGYMLVFFTTYNLINTKEELRKTLNYLIVGSFIVSMIGFLQFIGFDIFKTSFIKSFILPGQYQNSDINFTLGENIVYATLYHYNYVGSYTALLMPMFLAIGIFCKDKKLKIVSFLLAMLIGIVWIGSTSRAGYVGGTVALFVLIIMSGRKLLQNKKIALIAGILIVVGFVAANSIMDGYITKRLSSLMQDIGMIKGTQTEQVEQALPITYIESDKTGVKFDAYGKKFYIFKENGIPKLKEEVEGELNLKKNETENGLWTIDAPGYQDVQIRIGMPYENDPRKIFMFKWGLVSLNFDITKDNVVLVDNKYNKFTPEKAKSIGFEGKERMGSARGYIWSRTVPMIKDTAILGKGPDTFCIYFPQNDILAKLKAYDTMWMLVDKPHNLFLQIAFSSGVLSLIAFLVFVGGIVITIGRRYIFMTPDTDTQAIAVGVMVGTVGYVFAGFFNDSVVSVAPIFWIVMAIGYSAYYIDAKKVKM